MADYRTIDQNELVAIRIGVLSEGAMPGYLDMFLTFARFQTIATGNREDLQDVIAAVAQNRIRPVIDRPFTFNEGKAAFEFRQAQRVWEDCDYQRYLSARRSSAR
jgi:NADPH:quinone reductase-like Zn-dependent oxidoreductase